MTPVTPTKNQNPHIQDLSTRLQRDVEYILSKIDDATLTKEVNHDEQIEITGGVHVDVSKEMFDTRIHLNALKRTYKKPVIKESFTKTVAFTVEKTADINERAKKAVHFLFRPF